MGGIASYISQQLAANDVPRLSAADLTIPPPQARSLGKQKAVSPSKPNIRMRRRGSGSLEEEGGLPTELGALEAELQAEVRARLTLLWVGGLRGHYRLIFWSVDLMWLVLMPGFEWTSL